MPRHPARSIPSRWFLVLACLAPIVGRAVARAEDAPPTAAPTPSPGAPAVDPARVADLARATSLRQELMELFGKGRVADAIVLAREVLDLREKASGADSATTAESLNDLGFLLVHEGAYAAARPLYERALAIREKLHGSDHPDVAVSLNNLASLLHDEGAYAQARPLFERALAMKEKHLGKDHPSIALSLGNYASVLRDQGAYAEVRPLLERALAIRRQAYGDAHRDVGQSLNNLASFLESQGAYAEALPLYQQALGIWEATLGHDHPEVAIGLNNLAGLLRAQGAFAQAAALYERALSIVERTRGKAHPDVALILNNLGELHRHQGAHAEARPLYERAVAIGTTTLGEGHPRLATYLSNLALLLRAQGQFAEARPLYERALAIQEQARGRDHPDVATVLNNLAELLRAQGEHAEALPRYERAIAIQERALGPDHPELAVSLDNLAQLQRTRGALDDAHRLHRRALAILERTLGATHPSVATSLSNLAFLVGEQGDLAAARALYERILAMTEVHARSQFAALSATQRRALLQTTRYRLDNWLWLAPSVGLTGYRELLRFRGLVARAEAAERVLARRARGDDRRLREALQAAQHRAARLANQVPSSFKSELRAAWQRAYAESAAERERLTRELSRHVAPLRAALERMDLGLADVLARLGADTALVEFLRVRARYVGWVVRSTGEPVRIDLGPSEAIDAACVEFLAAVTDDGDAVAAGARLRALLWAPIEEKLGEGVTRLVICPDAAVAAVPFAALPGREAGRTLLDERGLSYVMQAQDLVPSPDAPPAGRGALIVGAVDYDRAEAGSDETSTPPRPGVRTASDHAPRGVEFLPIPQPQAEAQAVRDLLGTEGTTLLVGAGATEARLREGVPGKRFVHVATHGFAREDLLAGLYTRRLEETFLSADTERQLAAGHDPMLLSGLALAGANSREGGAGDDGILTALEASYLDLDGVELVTLSACETARGTAESGEGVQGLVSAFQLAGARRVIASLWRVDDLATRRLMEGVNERMLRAANPRSAADALREAALAVRDWKDPTGKARFSAPRYWAAFVMYGG